MSVTVILIVIEALGTVPKDLKESLEEVDDPNNSIDKISQHIKSRGELRRIALTQTPVKNLQDVKW